MSKKCLTICVFILLVCNISCALDPVSKQINIVLDKLQQGMLSKSAMRVMDCYVDPFVVIDGTPEQYTHENFLSLLETIFETNDYTTYEFKNRRVIKIYSNFVICICERHTKNAGMFPAEDAHNFSIDFILESGIWKIQTIKAL